MKRALFGLVLMAATVAATLVVAEGVARRLDGLPVLAARLPAVAPRAGRPSSRDTADLRYLPRVPLAPGVDAAWYPLNPSPHQPIPMTPAISARYEHYKTLDPIASFFAWNRVGLGEALCSPETAPSYGIYDDFYVFDPPGGSPLPLYRLLPHIQPPGWFPTGQFGWRGPDVALNKPAGTIRIAFLGSSKTIDPFGSPFSHIEYIGEWLSLWLRARNPNLRIEVVNAARTGIDEKAIAAILRDEVLPLEPDLVIDDGGNNFGPAMLLPKSARVLKRPDQATGDTRPWAMDAYSAISRHLHVAAIKLAHRDGSEPVKPRTAIEWPAGVDELHPDVTQQPLPMGVDELFRYYDGMRTALAAQGGQLALPSWIFMARDGLTLDLSRDLMLFNSLNWTYYPLTYAQLRRAADFYNRAFRAYAEHHGLLFLDVADGWPLDPELFGDTAHMTPQGLRLEAWSYLQMIVGWLGPRIDSGALPRPMQHPRDRHPAFATTEYPIVTRAEFQKACR